MLADRLALFLTAESAETADISISASLAVTSTPSGETMRREIVRQFVADEAHFRYGQSIFRPRVPIGRASSYFCR